MTVALDATYSVEREPTGVAVYSQRIIEELARLQPRERFLLGYRANRFFRAIRQPKPAKNCSRRLLEEAIAGWTLRGADIFHGLNQRLPRRRLARSVTTFHDLFVLTGDYSTPEFRRRFSSLAREAAERSDHVIAISQYTADLVADLLQFDRSRITVVHHGLDPVREASQSETAGFRRAWNLDGPLLLNLGALQRRKNITRLVEAFEGLPGSPLLALAGSFGYGSEEIKQRIGQSPARDRIRVMGYVDSVTRALLYRSATALVFPSLEEGFGMPVLEAMAAGLPVITSNRSALPEVAGGAALLVDPLETDEIREAMRQVLGDREARGALARSGLRRAAEFSWRRAAAETWDVYLRT